MLSLQCIRCAPAANRHCVAGHRADQNQLVQMITDLARLLVRVYTDHVQGMLEDRPDSA